MNSFFVTSSLLLLSFTFTAQPIHGEKPPSLNISDATEYAKVVLLGSSRLTSQKELDRILHLLTPFVVNGSSQDSLVTQLITETRKRLRTYKKDIEDLQPLVRHKATGKLAKIEVVCPLSLKCFGEYRRFLEPSLRLFWPSPRLLLLMDEESDADRFLGTVLEEDGQSNANGAIPVRVAYQPEGPLDWGVCTTNPARQAIHPAAEHGYQQVRSSRDQTKKIQLLRKCGTSRPVFWHRAQLESFKAHLYSDALYLAMVDADTIFTTAIIEESLFENGKPIVIGETGYFQFSDSNTYRHEKRLQDLKAENGAFFLGLGRDALKTFRFMSYFPVVVKRAHLAEMVAYLEKLHGISMDELFEAMAARSGPYSHFDFLLHWLYRFKHSEYSWHLQVHPSAPDSVATIGDRMSFHPVVRVAQHGVYDSYGPKGGWDEWESQASVAMALLNGYCAASLPAARPEQCNWKRSRRSTLINGALTKAEFWMELFIFESRNWLYDLMSISETWNTYLRRLQATAAKRKFDPFVLKFAFDTIAKPKTSSPERNDEL